MPNKPNEKQKMYAELFQDSMTRSEFESLAVKVAEKVKKIEDRNVNDFNAIVDVLQNYAKRIESDTGSNFGSLKSEINGTVQEKLASMAKQIDDKLAIIKDGIDGLNGIDGIDADEELIVEKVLEKVVLPEASSMKADDIKGLEKLIKKLIEKHNKSKYVNLGGGSMFSPDAFSRHMVENALLGTGDGTTKDFDLPLAPSPISSLMTKVGNSEMFLTDDFTLSNKTISFITAPPKGAKVRATLRV